MKTLQTYIKERKARDPEFADGYESGYQEFKKVFQLEPDSPLYNDLVELKERNERGELEFISHEEAYQ